MRSARVRLVLVSVPFALVLIGIVFAGSSPGVFPPAGVDLIEHELEVDVDVGDDGSVEETLVFQGNMTVDRGDPFVNRDGFRQIDFLVTRWTAFAQSEVLGDTVTYVLSPGVSQIPSTITAEQMGSDFPAYFKFNVIFDARLGDMTVFQEHHGMPEGGGHPVVPPNASSPPITTFEEEQITVNHPMLGPIRFIPKRCQDQVGTTIGDGVPMLGWPAMILLGIALAAVAAGVLLFVSRARPRTA